MYFFDCNKIKLRSSFVQLNVYIRKIMMYINLYKENLRLSIQLIRQSQVVLAELHIHFNV